MGAKRVTMLGAGSRMDTRLLMRLPDAVLIQTGNHIVFANKEAQRLFGVDEPALLCQRPESLRAADGEPRANVSIVRGNGTVRNVELVRMALPEFGEGSVLMILHDTTDLLETRTALADSNAALQRLLAVREQVQDKERQRIARDLHDDLNQALAAIRIHVAAAHQSLEPASPNVHALLEETTDLVANAIESTRRIINDLRPQILDDLGLLAALQALVIQFRRQSGIACRLAVHDHLTVDTPPAPQIATCLYRVAQESLGNVAQHAQASEVEVKFTRTIGGQISLRITDNGHGMNGSLTRSAHSFGLVSMHERVRAIGGVLRIETAPGVGTTIETLLPLSIDPMSARPDTQFSRRRRATDPPPTCRSTPPCR